MKNTVIAFALILLSAGSLSAQKDRIWLNNNLEYCKKNKATHYMLAVPSGSAYELKMYDLDNQLRMLGMSLDPKGDVFEGLFEYYHPNGQVESKGHYVADAKVGVWERFDSRGNRLAERTYAAFDASRMAYTYVDEMPVYDGGNENFEDFLKQKIAHLVNVSEFEANGSQLELGFVVNKDGKIEGVEFTKGHSPEWDVAALEELKALPFWIPGKKTGDEVRVYVRLPLDLSR